MDAAEAVTGAPLDTLSRLVDKNLLVRRRRDDGVTRLGILETIRAFAAELPSASGDHGAVSRRHFDYYLRLAEGHGSQQALGGLGSNQRLARLDVEGDNLRAALAWATSLRNAGPALAMTAALGWYWLHRARYWDALRWTDRTLDLPGAGDDAHAVFRVRVLCIQAICQWPVGHGADKGHAIAAEAVRLARSIGYPLPL